MSAEFVASVILAVCSLAGLIIKLIMDFRRLRKEIFEKDKNIENIQDKFVESIERIMLPITQRMDRIEDDFNKLELKIKDNNSKIQDLKQNEININNRIDKILTTKKD
ncbi:MAG: hypothetical protein IJK61_03665 [Bacteroidetes bacterium]|nr:hypothetical protein [Bacteroidota bacterium]